MASKTAITSMFGTYQATLRSVNTLYMLTFLGARQKRRELISQEIKMCEDLKLSDPMTKKLEELKESYRKNEFDVCESAIRAIRKSKKKTTSLPELHDCKQAPRLAREQAIVYFAAMFEGFLSDLLGRCLDEDSSLLKTDEKPLSYANIVSLYEKGILLDHIKKDIHSRTTRHDNVSARMTFFKDNVKFNVPMSDTITELFLIRNALVHNGRLVSKELTTKFPSYKLSSSIKVTDEQYVKFREEVLDLAELLANEFTNKYGER